MASKLYGMYGASGFGEEIMHWLDLDVSKEKEDSRIVYIDDGIENGFLNGYQVMSYQDFISQPEEFKYAVIAIANSEVRQRIDEKLQKDGIPQVEIQGAYGFVRGASLAEGAVISAYVDITNNVNIGRCFHINTYSYVGHDCRIGDYVTFAPRVSCNGNVHIEDHVYIGTGAIIKQGTPGKPLVIGKGAVVGMGAVVTKDVPPGVTVVGNPARPLVKS